MQKCECGKEVKYAVGQKPNGDMILSYNKYKKCPYGTDELNSVILCSRSCKSTMLEITDRAIRNLSFALGLKQNTNINTLMLNAAVHINKLTEEGNTRRHKVDEFRSDIDRAMQILL